MARTPLQVGDPSRIGRYRLTARLGAGGMGVVYLGEADSADEGNGLQVAVKLLRPELSGDPELRMRFDREVTTLARVRGVCTVRVLEADTEGLQPFLVTEYADGPSLAEYVVANGPLDPGMLYGLATGLAEALTAIHATGVAHRDLKPSNVLLTPSGPKVIDFGIAHVLDAAAVTDTGMTVGSAGFMAPEQITGRAGTEADIFAWAVMIGYAASGRSPFGTETSHATMYQILHAEPDIEAVPSALRPQVAAALAKDPQDRPSAHELLAQLTSTAVWPGRGGDSATQTVLLRTWRPASTGIDAPPGKDKGARPSARRHRILRRVALPLTALVAAAGTALVFTLAGHPAPPPAAALQVTTAPTRHPPSPRPSPVRTTPPATRPASTPPTPKPSTPSRAAIKSAAATAPALPVITVGSYTGMKPSQIAFGANLGNAVTGIEWSAWTATGATGYGQSDLDICLPDCVQAPANGTPATIVLSDPVHGRFTQLAETSNGSTATYTFPANWPVSAS